MAKNGLLQALPFLGGAAALAAPFAAPALFGADAAAAAAPAVADVGAAAAPATIGAAAPLATTAADITLPDVTVTAAPLSGDVGAGAGVGAGLSDALQGVAPALGTTLGTAGPVTEGGLGPPAGNAPVSANTFATFTPNDPAGLGAGATDLPGLDLSDQPVDAIASSPGQPQVTLNQPAIDAATAPGTAPAGGIGGTFSKIGDFLSANKGWIGPTAAVGGLGLEAIQGLKPIPGSGPVSGAAGTANTNAANLTAAATPNLQALATGTLPAGAQSAIDQAAKSAKASISSEFANMGITGPYSGEAEALASVDQNKATQQLQQMQNLVNVGATEAGLAHGEQGLASQDYLALMDAQIKQNAALQAALSRFAGSFAGPAVAAATS